PARRTWSAQVHLRGTRRGRSPSGTRRDRLPGIPRVQPVLAHFGPRDHRARLRTGMRPLGVSSGRAFTLSALARPVLASEVWVHAHEGQRFTPVPDAANHRPACHNKASLGGSSPSRSLERSTGATPTSEETDRRG